MNVRPFLETKPVSRSVRPVASSFFICSRSIGCCRIRRPERKSQLARRPDRLFADIGHAVLEHARAALRARAERLLLAESRALRRPSAAPWPKSNSRRSSSLRRIAGANGLPCWLRKPVSGPTKRLVISSAISSGDHSRPEITLPDREVAFLALELAVVLLHGRRRTWGTARARWRTPCPGISPFLITPTTLLHQLGDLVHELFARELAALDQLQLVLPLAGQLGRARARRCCSMCSANSSENAFGVGTSSRPSRWTYSSRIRPSMIAARVAGVPRPFAAHRLAQLLVLDQLARAFHRGKQRRFGVARRRLGLVGLRLRPPRTVTFSSWRDRRQVLVLLAAGAAVDREPARVLQHLAFGLELMLADARDARGLQILGRRIEHGEEAAHHQVVELLLGLVQAACGVCSVGMIAKWSEILLLSKMRLLGFTQPCFRICLANGAKSVASRRAPRAFSSPWRDSPPAARANRSADRSAPCAARRAPGRATASCAPGSRSARSLRAAGW